MPEYRVTESQGTVCMTTEETARDILSIIKSTHASIQALNGAILALDRRLSALEAMAAEARESAAVLH